MVNYNFIFYVSYSVRKLLFDFKITLHVHLQHYSRIVSIRFAKFNTVFDRRAVLWIL